MGERRSHDFALLLHVGLHRTRWPADKKTRIPFGGEDDRVHPLACLEMEGIAAERLRH